MVAAHGIYGDLNHGEFRESTPWLFPELPVPYRNRSEGRRDVEAVAHDNLCIRIRIVWPGDRERAAGRGGPWNVVVLDLAFYELRSSSFRLMSSNSSM
jgi:hypothetical protein